MKIGQFFHQAAEQIKGFGKGLVDETMMGVDEIGQGLEMGNRAFSDDAAVRTAQRKEIGQIVEVVRRDPKTVWAATKDRLFQPAKEAWENGRKGESIGRAVIQNLGIVLPLWGSQATIGVAKRILAKDAAKAAGTAAAVADTGLNEAVTGAVKITKDGV